MPELKRNFSAAKMNKDLDERLIPNGQYKDALNIQISTSDGSNIGSAQTLLGNTKKYAMNQVYGSSTTPVYSSILSADKATCVGSIAVPDKDKIYYFVAAGVNNTLGNAGATLDIQKDYIIEYDAVSEKLRYVFVDIYQVNEQASAASSGSDAFLYIPHLSSASINKTGVRIGMSVWSDQTSGWGSGNNVYTKEDGITVKDIIYNSGNTSYKIFLQKDGADFTPATGIDSSDVVKFSSPRVLNFDYNKKITGINHMGDMLYWTDGYTEPKKINITRSIKGTGGEEYLVGGGVTGFATGSPTNVTFEGDTDYFHTRLVLDEKKDGNYIIATDAAIQKAVYTEEKHITVIKKAPTQPIELEMSRTKNDRIPTGSTVANPTYVEYGTAKKWYDASSNIYTSGDSLDISFTNAWDVRVGDKLIFTNETSQSASSFNDYQVRAIVTSSVCTNANSLAGDANNPITITILSISRDLDDINEQWLCRREDEDPLFEFKFVRFSYRYKYEDGEYSPFAPWSQIAFLPDRFEYQPKKGHNLGMRNQLRDLRLTHYFPEPGAKSEDVVEIDLLYKETNNPTVYTIRTIKPTDIDPVWPDLTLNSSSSTPRRGSYEVKTDLVHALVPSNQLLRPWDNVPRKAIAQEISANRLIYGNYTQNYTVSWDPWILVSLDSKPYNDVNMADPSVKSMRTYQLGVVFSDNYGRETPILTNKNASIHVPKDLSISKNRLKVQLAKDTVIPSWAKYFSWYVKEPTTEYYTMAMDRWYEAADGNIWISFPSSERNKVDEETFLNLKKAHGTSTPVTDKARYKILAIENEAPDFIKTEAKSLGTMLNTNDDKIGSMSSGFPIPGTTFMTIHAPTFESVFGRSPDGTNTGAFTAPQAGMTSDLLLRTPDSFWLKMYGNSGEVSKEYEITKISKDESENTYKLRVKGRFEEDMRFVSGQDSYSSRTSGLRLELIEREIENRPEFDGRFFVKIHKDEILNSHVLLSSNNGNEMFTGNSFKLGYLNNNYYEQNPLNYWSYQKGGHAPSNVTTPPGVASNPSGREHPTEHSHHTPTYTWGNVSGQNSSYGITGGSGDPIDDDSVDELHVSPRADNFWKEVAQQRTFFIDACSAYSLTGRRGGTGNVKDFPGQLAGLHPNAAYSNNFKQAGGGYASADSGRAPGGEPSNMKTQCGQVSRGIWKWTDSFGPNHSLMDISWTGMGYDDPADTDNPHQIHNVTGNQDFANASAFIAELVQPGTKFRFQRDPDKTEYTVKEYSHYFTGQGHPVKNSPFHQNLTTLSSGAWGIRNFRTGSDKNQYLGYNLRQRWTILCEPEIGSGPSGYNPCTGTSSASTTDRRALKHDLRDFDVIEIRRPFTIASDPYKDTFSDNPAIWETEPKESVDLDIYYQASGLIPVNLEENTNEEYITIGATFNSYDDSTGLVAQEHTVESWNNRIITFAPAIPSSYSIADKEKLTFTKRDNYILTARADGASAATATTVKLHGGFSTTNNNYKLWRQEQILDWNNCWCFGNGVESDRIRDDFNAPQMDNGVKASSVLAEPIREEQRKHGLIWSGIYNSINGVNNTNQFIQAEKITKDLNPVYGSIQKLYNRATRLIMFCEDKVLRAVTNKDALYNADGKPQLVASNAVVGDVTPYQGDFGISTNPESFAATPGQLYFADAMRGQVLALEPNGIRSISNLGMKDYFADTLTKYIDTVQGTYDERKHEYNVTISRKYHKQQIAPEFLTTVSYSEKSNGWSSFKSFHPESGVSLNNQYYTFKNGEIYKHHDDTVITLNGTLGASATKINMSSVDGLVIGMVVSGTGVTKGSTIEAISALELTLDKSLEANFVTQDLEFTIPRNNFYSNLSDASAGYDNNNQYESNITLVFNDKPEAVKSFNTINYEGTQAKVTQITNKDNATGATTKNDAAGNTLSDLTDGEYFNLTAETGWYVDSITTNKQTGSVIDFKDKECKWFGAICGDATISSGSTMNIDEAEFSVQGLGNASFSFAGGGSGTPPDNPIIKTKFANNTSSSYNGGSGSAWDSASVITTEQSHWTVTESSISNYAGATVAGSTINLTISPIVNSIYTGYALSAGNFKIGNGTETSGGSGVWNTGSGSWNADSPITQVAFADLGTAGDPANTVRATITYGSFTCPTSDTTYYIDIDEDVAHTLHDRNVGLRAHWVYNSNQSVTISNLDNITETNVQTGDANTPGIYKFTGTSTDETTTKIVQIEFDSDSGYHYGEPTVSFLNTNGSYENAYSYSITPTYVSNRLIDKFVLKVYYTPPQETARTTDPINFLDLNHIIDINPDIIDTPAATSNAVTHMSYPSDISYLAQTVDIDVAGAPSTQYKIQFTKQENTGSDTVASSNGYYNFETEAFQTSDPLAASAAKTLDSNGKDTVSVTIPSSDSDVRYDILLSAAGSPSSTIPTTLDGHGEAMITQHGMHTITLKPISHTADIFGTLETTTLKFPKSFTRSKLGSSTTPIFTAIGGNENVSSTTINIDKSQDIRVGMNIILGLVNDGVTSTHGITVVSVKEGGAVVMSKAVAVPAGTKISFFEVNSNIISFDFTITPNKKVRALSVSGGDVGQQPNTTSTNALTTQTGHIDGLNEVEILTNGSISSSTTLTLDTTRGITSGMTVTGTGVSGTVTVSSVNSLTQVTLSSSQTIGNDVLLTFSGNVGTVLDIQASVSGANILVQGYVNISEANATSDILIRLEDFIQQVIY